MRDARLSPEELAGLLRDALRRSPGARLPFIGRAGLSSDALVIAEEALTLFGELQSRADVAWDIVDDAVKELRFFPGEKQAADVADDLDAALELLREARR